MTTLLWQIITGAFIGVAGLFGFKLWSSQRKVERMTAQEQNRKQAEDEWVKRAEDRLKAARSVNVAPIDTKKRNDLDNTL